MNASGLGSSMLYSKNASFNASFNSTMNFSRRGARGENTVIMSTAMTQNVEPYGIPLPAMVKGALSTPQVDNQKYSCRLDPNGWAWLVSGLKLYVWRHSQDIGKKSSITCRELALPPSELVHNAQLVTVLSSGVGTTAPSCVAVSPEGHITYWPSIANESSTVTLNADVPGQECDCLTSLWPTGCILTTTSATVLLIKPISGRGSKPSLITAPISVQKGWLGGWSKKVSTMLFTSMPAASSGLDNKRTRVIVPLSKDDDPTQPGHHREAKVYIFQGPTVQTWQITSDSNNCLSEVNIDEHLRKQFLDNVWSPADEDNRSDLRGIQSWILDVAAIPNSKTLAVFAAAKSQYETTENLVYGVVTFDIKSIRRRENWQFIPVTCRMGETIMEDEQLYSWKLLASQGYYYVVSSDAVLTASDKQDVPADSIESKQLGGSVIGAGLISGSHVVILVPKHGLLCVRPVPQNHEQFGLDDTYSDIRVPDHLALSITQANIADQSSSEDAVNRYKSAFLVFLQKKHEESMKMLQNLFPPSAPSLAPNDPIDLWTIAVCEKLIDEAPASDPRWVASFGRNDDQDPLGMKSKILIKNFLMDKKEGLELFFGFLNSTGIWPKLQGVVVKEDVVATGSLLYNNYEKVYFALSLQNMQSETHFRKAIDTAIKSIIRVRSEKDVQIRSSQLSANDLFYKDVSRVYQFIPALISIQEEDLGEIAPEEIPLRILQTNEIILRGILDVMNIQPGDKISQIHEFLIRPLMTSETNQYEVLSWLIQPSVLPFIMKQQSIIVEKGVQNHETETGIKIDLLKQLQQYTDLILDGMKMNVESIQGSAQRYEQKLSKFESNRRKLLRTHLEIDDYEGAGLLAEKYLDFETLAMICYNRQDLDRLEAYFDKYEHMDFPEFVFEWYVRQKKTAELIDTFSKSKFSPKLKTFLIRYPKLAWHHSAVTDDFVGAANTLKSLAEDEETYAEDKKFLLCMAKLAALASAGGGGDTMTVPDLKIYQEQNPFIQDIDRNLNLMEYQIRLSDEILNTFGMERTTMRVLNAGEMIDMYSSEDVPVDPENYWNAFGVADFMINEQLQKEKKLLIVARAIKRDPWDNYDTDHPMDVIKTSCLYEFLELALQRGKSLDELYPLEDLGSFPELKTLLESANARFLLRACHEHLTTNIIPNLEQQGDIDMSDD